MTIHIGTTIAALRGEKGVTQAQLAHAVGVSAPAISKWETGQSCPDITLLPSLARFFGVTVDRLLAYEAQLTEEERDAFSLRADAVFAKEGWEAGLAYIRKLFTEHPTDMELRMLFAMRLMGNMVFAADETQRNDGRRLQLEWVEQAANNTTGPKQLLSQFQLGVLYLNRRRPNEAEAALKPLEKLPLMNGVQSLLPGLRLMQERYEDGICLAQRNLFSSLLDAVSTLSILTTLAIRQENHSAARRYLETALCLARDTGLEDAFAIYTVAMRMRLALACRDTDALLLATEQYVEIAALSPRAMPATPLFDRLDQDGPTAVFQERDHALMRMLLEDLTTNTAYDVLREMPRFARLLQKMQAQTETFPSEIPQ